MRAAAQVGGHEPRGVTHRSDESAIGRAIDVEGVERQEPALGSADDPLRKKQAEERGHRIQSLLIPGGDVPVSGHGIAEAGPRHGQRLEDPSLDTLLIGLAGGGGDHLAQGDVAEIRIHRLLTGWMAQLVVLLEQLQGELMRGTSGLVGRMHPSHGDRVGQPAAVAQKVSHPDRRPAGAGLRELGKELLDRIVQAEHLLLHELHRRRGRDDLRHREPQVGGVRRGSPTRRQIAGPRRAELDDPVPDDRAGDTRCPPLHNLRELA